MMRPPLGARLAAAFPDARLVEVFDSYTLVPIDQPEALAAALGEFAGAQLARPHGAGVSPWARCSRPSSIARHGDCDHHRLWNALAAGV